MAILSFDIGGTNTKWGVFHQGVLISSGEFPSLAQYGGKHILQEMIDIAPLLMVDEKWDGVAISATGTIDVKQGKVIQATDTIPNYCGLEMKAILEEAFHVPVTVENDVNCALLAEVKAGVAQGCENVFAMTVGTGVGGGVYANGRIVHGAQGFAGEIGYLPSHGEILDLAGSTRGLISRIARAKGDEVKNWDGHRVMTSYRHQDEIVRREVHQMVENLTDVMALATSLLNPEMIVLGGGIMTQKDILLPLCEASFRKKVPARIGECTHIEACHFNNQAGIYGAYYNFLEKEAIHK